jgi:hypothetical protein
MVVIGRLAGCNWWLLYGSLSYLYVENDKVKSALDLKLWRNCLPYPLLVNSSHGLTIRVFPIGYNSRFFPVTISCNWSAIFHLSLCFLFLIGLVPARQVHIPSRSLAVAIETGDCYGWFFSSTFTPEDRLCWNGWNHHYPVQSSRRR